MKSSNNYKKTLICISAPTNKGKTETAINVRDILIKNPSSNIIQQCFNLKKMPVSWIIQLKNQIIGVDIEGDPNTNFLVNINKLASYPCDAIVCTTRTSGVTIIAAQKAAAKNNMLLIKTTTYQPDDPAIKSTMNCYKAEHIIDLLKKRGHL
jgi:hypothetical protein